MEVLIFINTSTSTSINHGFLGHLFRTGKNGFVTAAKLGTTNKIFVAATKNFAAGTKRFVDRTKYSVVVTKCFCYPYFNK